MSTKPPNSFINSMTSSTVFTPLERFSLYISIFMGDSLPGPSCWAFTFIFVPASSFKFWRIFSIMIVALSLSCQSLKTVLILPIISLASCPSPCPDLAYDADIPAIPFICPSASFKRLSFSVADKSPRDKT